MKLIGKLQKVMKYRCKEDRERMTKAAKH